MATNGAIRDAVVDVLSDVTGLNVYRYPIDGITAPAAVIAGFSNVESAMGGRYDTQLDVYVMVSRRHVDQFEALDELTDMVGARSVPQALNECDVDGLSLAVVGVGDYRELVVADVPYYSATVTLRVLH
jgi:hypothetical protein